MKKIVSLLLAGTISLGGIPTALSHYIGGFKWNHSTDTVSVIPESKDSSCKIDICVQTEEHEHDICTVEDCTETTYHEHDTILYLPDRTDDPFTYSYFNCINIEQHTHSSTPRHGRKHETTHH